MTKLCDDIWTMFFEHIEGCESCSKQFNDLIQRIIDPIMKSISGALQGPQENVDVSFTTKKDNGTKL